MFLSAFDISFFSFLSFILCHGRSLYYPVVQNKDSHNVTVLVNGVYSVILNFDLEMYYR